MTDTDTTNDTPDVQPISDPDTPLVDMALTNGLIHHIQHICELFTSAFLPFFYVGSNRKRRKKVSELKKEIDERTEGKED
ncbi:hypothetical protein [Schaedlerella sp.]|uniref:hypothetical protein n=1 Tax=Schaedlerella sp. TaxID=2676057 RepID=UPI0037455015